MARLKYVLNERRLAYEGAVEVFKGKAKVRLLQRQIRREQHKATMARLAEEKAQTEKELAAASGAAETNTEAANLAVAGLLETTASS
jgi:large subunit ribosomal protein L47